MKAADPYDPRVDAYINKSAPFAQPILTHLRELVHKTVPDIEESIKVQATILESARTAMSQTDDLVERVVEALESLQSAVLDSNEAPAEPIAFAVN